MKLKTPLAPQYLQPLKGANNLTLLFFLLGVMGWAGCGCDGLGALELPLIFAVIAFWAGTAIICQRRPKEPTKGDLRYIRYGQFSLSVFSYFFTPLIWMLRGHRF